MVRRSRMAGIGQCDGPHHSTGRKAFSSTMKKRCFFTGSTRASALPEEHRTLSFPLRKTVGPLRCKTSMSATVAVDTFEVPLEMNRMHGVHQHRLTISNPYSLALLLVKSVKFPQQSRRSFETKRTGSQIYASTKWAHHTDLGCQQLRT